jgi:hypothetical protein
MICLHWTYPHAARFGLTVVALCAVASSLYAVGPDVGQAQQQAINWTAIEMFGVFVMFTLLITKWAAARTKSAADFYTAGGALRVSRTVWRLPVTSCLRHRSWVFRQR